MLLGSPCPGGAPAVVNKGSRLAAVVTDRVRVVKAGNTRGGQILAQHMTMMPAS